MTSSAETAEGDALEGRSGRSPEKPTSTERTHMSVVETDVPPEQVLLDPAQLELRAGLPQIVETVGDLVGTVETFQLGSGPVAIDAERASGFRYSPRAYLVQLRRAGAGTALIDPVPLGDVPNEALRPLAEVVADVPWVLHAASQDLACLAELGMRPRELFDTELAGRLLNYPRVGLAVMVEELVGYRMRKEHSAVDWSRRPLPESWLRYAALDVEVLLELRDVLAEQLEEQGKDDWARQEFAALAATTFGQPRSEPWRRTSGIHRVRGRRGLAIVRALWEQRNEIARQRDTAPSRIVSDAALVEAATAMPQSRNALSRLPTFSTRGGQRYVRQFWPALREATTLDEEELPTVAASVEGPPPARTWSSRSPAAARRLALCKQAVSDLAGECVVPQENLVPPDAVRRLAWQPPPTPTADNVAEALARTGARPWQVEITAGPLAAAISSA